MLPLTTSYPAVTSVRRGSAARLASRFFALFIAISFTISLAAFSPLALATPPTFTGDVSVDFDPEVEGVIVISDPGGIDVPIPAPFTAPSGFDIEDVRLYYDRATDILYIGLNTYVIAGDIDNDGDPNGTSPEMEAMEGTDEIDFDKGESFGLIIDTNNDGLGDAVAGVNAVGDLTTFGTYKFFENAGALAVPPYGFQYPLPSQSGTTTDPSTMGPDLEFTIVNFSGLPNLPYDPRENPITIGVHAFQANYEVDFIGEDYVPIHRELALVEFPYPGIVSGRVFHDLDADGVKDPGEPGIPDITVDLLAEFSGGDDQTESFDSLGAGLYGFYVDVPAFETASCTMTIAPASYAGWSPTTPTTFVVGGLVAGQVSAGHHFGFVPGPATLAGTVFDDLDGDGQQDAGEPGIAGVTVTLDATIDGGGNVSVDAATGSDGVYVLALDLEDEQTADCTVSVDPLDLHPSVATTATSATYDDVASGQTVDAADFGFVAPSFSIVVEGQIFVDNNGDGASSGDLDGMGGIPVYLSVDIQGQNNAYETTTAGDGRYAFEIPIASEATADLLAYVSENDLPGTKFTTPESVFFDDVAPDAEVEASFGFQPHRVPVFGDWDGDGEFTVGLFETSSSTFYFRNENSDGPAEIAVPFGLPGDIPLAGDWNGDGKHGIGTYTPGESRFRLRNTLTEGEPDYNFRFGPPNLEPLVGDWNGDGIETIGIHDQYTRAFFLRDAHAGGAADYFYKFGARHCIGVAGDWDGDGQDTIGIYHPPEKTFFLANSHGGGHADYTFRFAGRYLYPVVGDWDGDGDETIGAYNAPRDLFHLRNSNDGGVPDATFEFTTNRWIPIYGDWNGDGTQTVGAYDPVRSRWLVRNTNTSGHEDIMFDFGEPNQVPLVGDWNGDGADSPGYYNRNTRYFHLRDDLTSGDANLVFKYGGSNKEPVVGDWNSDGIDSIGIYDAPTGVFFLRDSNSGGNANYTAAFDEPNRTPIIGDWDGNGTDTIGTYEVESGIYRLANFNQSVEPSIVLEFGEVHSIPLTGDWNGDGYTTVGAYRAVTGKHQLRNANSTGPADVLLTFPIPFW